MGEMMALYVTAASIGFFHTILGPDHYIPFIVMGKARGWSLAGTAVITFLCGLGHIMSSIVLGVVGVIFGVVVMRLEMLESVRGNLAGWVLMGFGFAYFLWGVRMIMKKTSHRHPHPHAEEHGHAHDHTHTGEHAHVHEKKGKTNITPWILFTIFVLGPCEPLIPILMYPAAKKSVAGLIGVTLTFGVATVATMLGVVVIASRGVNLLPLGRLERYGHALAGAAILLCGVAIQFLGL